VHPRVTVEKPPDHPLVLRAVFLGFTLEELNAALRERKRDLYPLLAKR
jgi:hypothetical protein